MMEFSDARGVECSPLGSHKLNRPKVYSAVFAWGWGLIFSPLKQNMGRVDLR